MVDRDIDRKIKSVYLDYAATTPTRPEVVAAMTPYFFDFSGNPSSRHSYGHKSKESMLGAHAKVAGIIGCAPDEIIFTGSGTEADNCVIKGVADAAETKGRHLITSAIEHHAVLRCCKYLAERGYQITYLPVDSYGMVDPDEVRKAITRETILISIMYANNEVGTLQPISEISEIARSAGVLFHSDGVQALGHMPVNIEKIGVDFFSMSAHKFYGPKGVGACYIRRNSLFTPLLHGGGQERGLRSSTPNVPGVAGFSKALELVIDELDEGTRHLNSLRKRLLDGLQNSVDDLHINGHGTKAVPHIINIRVNGVDNDALIDALDKEGIYISKGAACGSAYTEPSHVLLAMGLSAEQALNSVRFSLGKWNTEEEIDYVLDVLPGIISKLR